MILVPKLFFNLPFALCFLFLLILKIYFKKVLVKATISTAEYDKKKHVSLTDSW